MSQPVPIDSVMQALASGVVSTRQYLQRTNEALAVAYSEHALLADQARPSFVIDQVTFDVPYVVDGVLQLQPEQPTLAKRRGLVLTDREVASLVRGAGQDAAGMLKDLLAAHAEHQALYTQLSQSRDPLTVAADLQLPQPVDVAPAALAKLRVGASRSAVDKLDRALAELAEMRAEITAVKQAAAAGPVTQVLVRLDPEAIAGAGGAVHRVQFSLRVDEAYPVQAGDTTVTDWRG